MDLSSGTISEPQQTDKPFWNDTYSRRKRQGLATGGSKPPVAFPRHVEDYSFNHH
jgi:hypothetical protein